MEIAPNKAPRVATYYNAYFFILFMAKVWITLGALQEILPELRYYFFRRQMSDINKGCNILIWGVNKLASEAGAKLSKYFTQFAIVISTTPLNDQIKNQ